jgi:dTMP kinase
MFITFEGMDGSGKTTQVSRTAAYLRERGYDLLLTREPGGTIIGDAIRDLLLDKADHAEPMHPRTELLLFNASRAQLVDEIIRPHLARGGVVICDRYIDSTIAYQGYGHRLDVQMVAEVVNCATGGLYPDLTLYLDITPEEGLRRRAAGSLFGEEINRLDDMEIAFHQRVYQGYSDIGQAETHRWARIDAAQTADRVHQAIVRILEQRLPSVQSGGLQKGKTR